MIIELKTLKYSILYIRRVCKSESLNKSQSHLILHKKSDWDITHTSHTKSETKRYKEIKESQSSGHNDSPIFKSYKESTSHEYGR